MQFYLDGYRPGDPLVADPHPSVAGRPAGVPDETDVLIVGCGPAGLVLAAQMAKFPDVRTVVIDRRDAPLAVGQADGVACRTVEMLQTFGLASRLVDEAYWVNEVCFWQPDPADRSRIRRAGRVCDTDAEVSEFPHVIVNQARMLAYLLDHMQRSASRLAPFYGLHASDLSIETSGDVDYPVTVTLRHVEAGVQTGETSVIRAKYVVGCDGARSAIRNAIGRELVGDAMDVSWGVMDVLGITDFPDIRLKCTIQSAEHGSIVLIPREGGYLARFYIELDRRELLQDGSVTPERLTAVANRILYPYTLEVSDVGWWSVYEIGQRLCDKFDDVGVQETSGRLPRVFITGDACHTHSAKAGQGMNVSMADAFNLGWKLGAVLRGIAEPELLNTYSEERQRVAQELIEFDEEWSRMLSSPPKVSGDSGAQGVDPEEVRPLFRQTPRLYRRRGDDLQAVDPHRHRGVPTPGARLCDRPALSLRTGDQARRRQADAAGARRARGRGLAPVHLRRSRRPDRAAIQGGHPVRLSRLRRLSGRALHPSGCESRRRTRRPRDLPAGPSRPPARDHAATAAAQEGTVRPSRLREDLLLGSRRR